MSDYGEIASAVARLAWIVDHKEEQAGYMECWTEDAVLDYTFADGTHYNWNAEEIAGLLKTSYTTPETECLHIPTNPVIDIDGDTARARYYVILTRMGPQARPVGVGECDAQLRKCADGRWRVAVLKEVQLLVYTQIDG